LANVIKLPSGATVSLKDPSLLKIRDRKKIIKASESETGEMSKAVALGDAILAMMIDDWSFDLLIPSIKIDSLDDLSPADYDALVKATEESSTYLFPKLQDNDENKADPESPLGDLKD